MNIFGYQPSTTTRFTIKNIAPDKKTIKVFQYPIAWLKSRDLLKIPGVAEDDIKASLLKGELKVKILAREIAIEFSDASLLTFNTDQKNFILNTGTGGNPGVMIGVDPGSSGGGSFTPGGDLSGTDTNQIVTGIQGRAIDSAAPTNNQVLTWNSTTSKWEPKTPTGGGSIPYLFRDQIALIGTQNGVNRTFTTPEYFINGSFNSNIIKIEITHNGRVLLQGTDYNVSESGGVGTGYDTITFISFAPTSDNVILANYLISN